MVTLTMAANMTHVELQQPEMIAIKEEIFEPMAIKTEPLDDDWDRLKQVNMQEDVHFHGDPELSAPSPVPQLATRIKTEPTSDPPAVDTRIPSKDELLYGNACSLNPLLEDEKIESLKCEPDANDTTRSEILRELLLKPTPPSSNDEPETLLDVSQQPGPSAHLSAPEVTDRYLPSSNHLNQLGPGSATGAMCVIPREVGLRYVKTSEAAPEKDGEQQRLKRLGDQLIKHLKEIQLQGGWDPAKWKKRKIRENILRRMKEKFQQHATVEPKEPIQQNRTRKVTKSRFRVERIQQLKDVTIFNVDLHKNRQVKDNEPVSVVSIDNEHTQEVTVEEGIGRPKVDKPPVDNKVISIPNNIDRAKDHKQQSGDEGIGTLNVDKPPVDNKVVSIPNNVDRAKGHKQQSDDKGIGILNVGKSKCRKRRGNDVVISIVNVDRAKDHKRQVDDEDVNTLNIDPAKCRKHQVDDEDKSTLNVDPAKCGKQQVDDKDVSTLNVDPAKYRKQQVDDNDASTLNVDTAKYRKQGAEEDEQGLSRPKRRKRSSWSGSFWGCSLCKEEVFFSSTDLLKHKASTHHDESMQAYFVSPISLSSDKGQIVTTSSVSLEGTKELDQFPIVSERLPEGLRSIIVDKIRSLSAPSRRPRAPRTPRTRGSANPSICEFCGKVFTHLGDCNKHRRSHTGERPHVCNVGGCRTSFATHSNLARHRKLHLGVRYRCEACNAAYSRRDKLVVHARVCLGRRLGEMRVPDEDITISDSDRDAVLSSVKFVKTEQSILFVCRACEATFLNVWQFIKHRDTHTAAELSVETSDSNTEGSETRVGLQCEDGNS